MLERLGNVLYWLGCAGAAVVVGVSALIVSDAPHPISTTAWIAIFVAAFLIWLTGRAIRYVLAGR